MTNEPPYNFPGRQCTLTPEPVGRRKRPVSATIQQEYSATFQTESLLSVREAATRKRAEPRLTSRPHLSGAGVASGGVLTFSRYK